MPRVVFRLREGTLHADGGPLAGGQRPLSDADWQAFEGWVTAYRTAATQPEALLALGADIHTWLDGAQRWVTRLRQEGGAPVIAEFAVENQADDHARSFLAVPWELLADGARHLAADETVQWAPLRRIGPERDKPAPRADLKLGMMFMAADPQGQTELAYEREEAGILRATERTGLDLFVEETGSLDDLSAAWSDAASLDVLHLSCHGMGGAEPWLALETEGGELDRVNVPRFVGAFPGQSRPRLLFLSACHTGEDQPDIDSLARRIVAAGFPAVLGWADAVYDSDAAAFAAEFYGKRSRRNASVEDAWVAARFVLLNGRDGRHPPRHWHLARLLLGPSGGGALSNGRAPRTRHDADHGRKRFLDARQQKVEVASRFEFVGRRREIQKILREFRDPAHAGVLIHGFGRQGKSSLAARIVDRVEHEPVVSFQRCDAGAVLKAIRDALAAEPKVTAVCDAFIDQVDRYKPGGDPARLYDALRALFKAPCGYFGQGSPILLILDDFEALLDPPQEGGHWRVQAEVVAPLSAIIRAFDQGGTDSRLLITSRYTFPLSADGRDLAARLLTVSLPQMTEAGALKQVRQKAFASFGDAAEAKLRDNTELTQRAVRAARGNAGLQDILFQAVMEDPPAGEKAVAALEAFLDQGDLPADPGKLRETLEKLAIDTLIGALTDSESGLLRASTLSPTPLPFEVWSGFAAGAGYGDPSRLLAFGLWERVPDLVNPECEAVVRNAIAGERIGSLSEADAKTVAAAIVPRLYNAWGGIEGVRRSHVAPLTLATLAMVAGNIEVLEATALHAVRSLEAIDAYRQAANFATNCMVALKGAGRNPSPDLLRAASEMYDSVGDADGLRLVWAVAEKTGALADDPALPADERRSRAQLRVCHAGYLVQQGDPDRAIPVLETTRDVFEALGDRRERAVTLGDIARIKTDKGEMDAALQLQHERLQVNRTWRIRGGHGGQVLD